MLLDIVERRDFARERSKERHFLGLLSNHETCAASTLLHQCPGALRQESLKSTPWLEALTAFGPMQLPPLELSLLGLETPPTAD
jgi:hypothetical protein